MDAVDTGGAPTASTLRRYSAFGVPGEAAPAQSIERGFASRPIEGASGLVYMRARHYDPTTGRFLQPDPEGIASTQRYAFAEHNPYIYNDPTGRSSRGIGSLDRGVPSWAFEGRPNELAGWDVATAAFGDGGLGLSGLVQHDAAVRGRWADEAWDDGRYASWAANSTMAMFNEYVGGEVAHSLENPGQTIALAAVGGLAFKVAARATGAAVRGATTGTARLPNARGFIREFTTTGDETFFRVFSGKPQGSFLTKTRPRSSAFAREALDLPQDLNRADFIQEVLVPAGTRLRRSRVSGGTFGGRGGAEQFELLNRISDKSFGPGVPFP